VFGSSAEVSARHLGTGAALSRHFGTNQMVPKCHGFEVSRHFIEARVMV